MVDLVEVVDLVQVLIDLVEPTEVEVAAMVDMVEVKLVFTVDMVRVDMEVLEGILH